LKSGKRYEPQTSKYTIQSSQSCYWHLTDVTNCVIIWGWEGLPFHSILLVLSF
jgi:hypothetical protein